MKRAQKVQPIERFPAKPRHDGRFQKRIRGILYYFGRDGDRKAALSEYDAAKVDLYAGRRPRADAIATAGELTVKEIGNRFLADKKPDIQPDTYRGYKRAIKRFVKRIGVARIWNDLTPDDFSTHGRYLRVTLKLANASYNIERAGILAMFNHAEAQDWIDRAPKFGNSFRRVPKSKMRTTRAKKLLSFEEIAALLSVCSADLFGMILLGLNGGFGASDCAQLPRGKVDFAAGMVHFPRTKNNIPRTVTLWPETLAALRVLCKARPNDDLIFRTKYGNAWNVAAVAHQLRKAVKIAEVPLPKNVGLYACRHTFATYANEVRDTDARRHIMGRLLPNLDDVYVETLFSERLKAVTDHVRTRLRIADLVGDRRFF